MESEQEVRSLKRGLSALVFLNQSKAVSIAELARELGLARSTAERILWTLEVEGFVARVPGQRRFGLTAKVRALSMGFSEQSWLVQSSAPLLFDMTRKINWPLGISVLSGGKMALEITTDPATAFWLTRRHSGIETPIGMATTGMVYLAFLPPAERQALIDYTLSDASLAPPWFWDEAVRTERIDLVRERGYSFSPSGGTGTEDSVSLPILGPDGRIMGALFMVFMVKVLKRADVITQFLPGLQALAQTLSEEMALHEKAAMDTRAPQGDQASSAKRLS